MRKLYIAGNWKMNKTSSSAVKYAEELLKADIDKNVKVMVAPSFVCLADVCRVLKGSGIIVAAQNLNEHDSGAYTGEVSCEMLKDIGVNDVIIGHSERRLYYGETDSIVNLKIKKALSENMNVILCVGETLEQRESGLLEKVLHDQITIGLKDINPDDMKKITVAYEPVWAIGTGKTATPEDAQSAHAYIRSLIKNQFGSLVGDNTIIQYGGSVKPENVRALMDCEDIDGALVGGASLKIDQFLPIINVYK